MLRYRRRRGVLCAGNTMNVTGSDVCLPAQRLDESEKKVNATNRETMNERRGGSSATPITRRAAEACGSPWRAWGARAADGPPAGCSLKVEVFSSFLLLLLVLQLLLSVAPRNPFSSASPLWSALRLPVYIDSTSTSDVLLHIMLRSVTSQH